MPSHFFAPEGEELAEKKSEGQHRFKDFCSDILCGQRIAKCGQRTPKTDVSSAILCLLGFVPRAENSRGRNHLNSLPAQKPLRGGFSAHGILFLRAKNSKSHRIAKATPHFEFFVRILCPAKNSGHKIPEPTFGLTSSSQLRTSYYR